jgi:predicted flap endonuclease-1-like 5' DNA nuclease
MNNIAVVLQFQLLCSEGGKMHGLLAFQLWLLFAPEFQEGPGIILGLPWWVWLLALIVIIILVYLLFRPAPEEVEPFVDEEKTSSPAVEEEEKPVPTPIETEKEVAPVKEEGKTVSPFTDEIQSLDDLTIIEGIGPKISGILYDAGLDTFPKVAQTTPAQITAILNAAGITLFDATTWPEQASLIASARWEELKALQNKLIGGRKA